MNTEQFFQQLETRIAKYDLLCHPFYKAWSAGELTKEDLRAYAQDYYHHVKAFPTYLAELAVRLDECELRRAPAPVPPESRPPGGGAGSGGFVIRWLPAFRQGHRETERSDRTPGVGPGRALENAPDGSRSGFRNRVHGTRPRTR